MMSRCLDDYYIISMLLLTVMIIVFGAAGQGSASKKENNCSEVQEKRYGRRVASKACRGALWMRCSVTACASCLLQTRQRGIAIDVFTLKCRDRQRQRLPNSRSLRTARLRPDRSHVSTLLFPAPSGARAPSLSYWLLLRCFLFYVTLC